MLAKAFLAPASAQVASVLKDTIATRVQLPGADCALFPAAANLGSWFGKDFTQLLRFTPTRAQAAEAEQALPRVHLAKLYQYPVTDYYARYPAIIKQHLSKYQRQYFGFYKAQHQTCLFINFFIEEVEYAPGTLPSWLTHPVQVADGGAGFWHIYYNLTTHKFYNFSHGMEG
ncbi:MAG: hypothetical protein EOO62_25370 [Hymenobacter sp.]|nr:MAG: hypothetical protein EOO62_25370 [Hymenobacter sp.]